MSGWRIDIDVGALVIEFYMHIWITLGRFDYRRVERRAADRIDVLVRIDVVGREDRARSRACGMDHSAAHWDRVFQYFISNTDLLERVNSAGRKREIDRTSTDHVAFARIGPAFVKIDLVSAPAEIGRK